MRVVACGNITPSVFSMYWWKGEVQKDEESFIFMETSDERIEEAIETIKRLHPYEVPKILSIEPTKVNASYLEWLQLETQR